MNNTYGFSLLFFLLYLMIFSIITLCICQVITLLIIPSLQSSREYKDRVALHSALDAFVGDVRSASQYSWKRVMHNELLWNNGKNDIGWHYNNNRLERSEGEYGTAKWKKKTTSIIASGLSSVTFTPDYMSGDIIGIALQLSSKRTLEKPVFCYVSVKKS